MIVNQLGGNGQFSIHQFPLDIKGDLPVTQIGQLFFSFDREPDTNEVVLNRFSINEGLLLDKKTYRQLPSVSPRYMIPVGSDKLLVSEGFRDGGITHLALYMLTSADSIIPGLIPITTSSTEATTSDFASSTRQTTIVTPSSAPDSSNNREAVAGSTIGGILIGLVAGIPGGLGASWLADKAYSTFVAKPPLSEPAELQQVTTYPEAEPPKYSDVVRRPPDIGKPLDLADELAPGTRPSINFDLSDAPQVAVAGNMPPAPLTTAPDRPDIGEEVKTDLLRILEEQDKEEEDQ